MSDLVQFAFTDGRALMSTPTGVVAVAFAAFCLYKAVTVFFGWET